MLIPAPEPAMVIEEVLPALRFVGVPAIALLSVRVLPPTVYVPEVSVRVPLRLRLAFAAEPVELLGGRLFNAETLLGTFIPEPEPAIVIEEVLPALKFVGVPAIALLSVSVLAPTVYVPEVSVRVPLTLRLACAAEPFELLSVRLFRAETLLGTFIPEPEPAMVIEEVLPALKFVGVPAIALLSVSVLAPTV